MELLSWFPLKQGETLTGANHHATNEDYISSLF